MKRPHAFCVALLGVVGLAALSCSKMDRSAPSAEPTAVSVSATTKSTEDAPKDKAKREGQKRDEWGDGDEDRRGKQDPSRVAPALGEKTNLLELKKLIAPPEPKPSPAAPRPESVARPFGGVHPPAPDPARPMNAPPPGAAAPHKKPVVDRSEASAVVELGLVDAPAQAPAESASRDGTLAADAEERPTDALRTREREKPGAKGGRADDDRERSEGKESAVAWGRQSPPKPEPEAPRPESFLPRMFYFENTYLGGNAAFTRRLLALDQVWPGSEKPYAQAAGLRQPFDAPGAAGLGLTVNVDHSHFDKPGRVFLQIGLQGSPRFGWRRPPLDLVVVVDAAVLGQAREAVDEIAREALRRLEPTDRMAIVLAGAPPQVLLDLAGPRDLRTQMARALDGLPTSVDAGTPGVLGTAIRLAGARLHEAAGNEARIPGAQEVLVLARAADGERVGPAAEAAHEIGIAGVITSVVRFDAAGDAGASTLAFWDIAQAGQGNLRAIAFGAPAAPVVTAELADLSRVVARLIRVNVRLGARVEAVRVLGSRMLARDEVARVKAREEAVDRNLSRSLGVKADRGADDDGIQTVIPYFYGGDTHVMALELWVEGPGPVADVSLKYKDMVNLGNATARANAALTSTPRSLTGAEFMVRRNIEAFHAAETLAEAARRLEAGDTDGAVELVARVERGHGRGATGAVARQFGQVLRGGGDPALQSEALRLAAARTVGVFTGATK